MKRDTLFYRIFQRSPALLFDLLPSPPIDCEGYRFESIEVKETSFRIDGVLLPPNPQGTVVFSEFQMQPDDKLYERLLSEIAIYTYRHTEQFHDWRAIVIYPTRSIEQATTKVPIELFQSGRISPVYLDEIGEIQNLPLGLALLVLTILEGEEALLQARSIVTRSKQLPDGDAIMELLSTILIYKFTTLSRDEVKAMLDYSVDALKRTRFYQDVTDEVIEEQSQNWLNQGIEQGQISLILRLLQSKLGPLPDPTIAQVQALKGDRLPELSLALLDFTQLQDLQAWLNPAES